MPECIIYWREVHKISRRKYEGKIEFEVVPDVNRISPKPIPPLSITCCSDMSGIINGFGWHSFEIRYKTRDWIQPNDHEAAELWIMKNGDEIDINCKFCPSCGTNIEFRQAPTLKLYPVYKDVKERRVKGWKHKKENH